MNNDDYYKYNVTFSFKDETYSHDVYSSLELTEDTDKALAWSIAQDAFDRAGFKDKDPGEVPHSIVIRWDDKEFHL